MRLVSVIIPTYNRAEGVCACVESILDSTYQNIEIIIVDNHSTDHTEEVVKELFDKNAKVRYVRLNENRMASGGRNAGILVATGDYFLFIDDDNLIYSDMIELLVKEMDLDENIGLVGPLTINVNLGSTLWMASGDYNFFTSRPKALYKGMKPENVPLKHRYPTCYSPNAMMVSRKAMEIVKEFDESYYLMFEEADLGYRIKNAGFQEYIVTAARTNHLFSLGEGQNRKLRELEFETPLRAFHFAKNRSIFMKKYAKWYHKIGYFGVMVHLVAVYYCFQAISCKRCDIARAWLKGTWKGIFWKKNDGGSTDYTKKEVDTYAK